MGTGLTSNKKENNILTGHSQSAYNIGPPPEYSALSSAPTNNLPYNPQAINGNNIKTGQSVITINGFEKALSNVYKKKYKRFLKIQAVLLLIAVVWSFFNRVLINLTIIDSDNKQEDIDGIKSHQYLTWAKFGLGVLYLVCSLFWYHVVCRKKGFGACSYYLLMILCALNYISWFIWIVYVDGVLINIQL